MQRSQRTPLTWIVALPVAIRGDGTGAAWRSRTSRSARLIRSGSCVAQTTVVPVSCASSARSAADLERRGGVESRRRLVGDDDGRARREDPGERDALTLAGRQQLDAALGVRRETDSGERLRRSLRAPRRPRRLAARGRARRSRVRRGSRRGPAPARRLRCAPAGGPRGLPGRASRSPRLAEHDLALVRDVEAGQQREQGRLAGAGRADDDGELARQERRVDAVERHL